MIDLPDPDDPSVPPARRASLLSRRAVEAHDREAWLALFAPDALVADPVGVSAFDPAGQGHRGPEAIANFWDTMIAPNQISMDITGSYAGGDEVANLVTIITSFPDGSRALVDTVATYRVDGQGRILALRAFWEMEQMRFEPAPG